MKIYPSLTEDLTEWANAQPLFITGTAPTHAPHINLSPKGMSSHFAVLSPNRVAYLDCTGSGIETISHVYENGRLTLMFLSFGPAPRIMRLFCTARVVEYTDPAFQAHVDEIIAVRRGLGDGPARENFVGVRAVIVGDIWRVTTSCGFAVPLLADGVAGFEERDTLDRYNEKKEERGKLPEYRAEHNTRSLDGLPGLRVARRQNGEVLLWGDVRSRLARVWHEKLSVCVGFLLAVLVYVVGARSGLL